MISRTLTLTLTLIICLLITTVHADVRGQPQPTLNYHQETDKINDPLVDYVTQGNTIYQGRVYDFSGITGAQYQYAWWKDWKLENTNCNPDRTMNIFYPETLINPKAVWLDPARWPVGDWYYWDMLECNITYYDHDTKKATQKNVPLQADNKLAFIIKKGPANIIPAQYTIPMFIPVDGYKTAYPTTTPAQVR